MSRPHSQSYVSFNSAAVRAVAVAVASVYYIGIFFANQCGNATAQEFVYPGQAKSERDLSTCAQYEICSVVHKRYWFPHRVERLCRCDGLECPSSWSESPHHEHYNYTMMLNNRAQIKFCESVIALPSCLATSAIYDSNATPATATSTSTVTATAKATTTGTRTQQRFLQIVNETRAEIVNNVTVNDYKLSSKAECFCPPNNRWIPHELRKNQSASGAVAVTSTWSWYRCSELSKCKAGDKCGFERTDFYSNYYICSCPNGHLCLRQNHSVVHQVNEMLYEGPAFQTNCQRKKTKQEVYGIDVDVASAPSAAPATP